MRAKETRLRIKTFKNDMLTGRKTADTVPAEALALEGSDIKKPSKETSSLPSGLAIGTEVESDRVDLGALAELGDGVEKKEPGSSRILDGACDAVV
eukprot:CAMPEP_0195010654 /NCGR_PEP_ID=MMETSP0326_2-20130528/10302_1 /TAXON_ID=2866 ORGANISM="Crypthecodinium cohnii, Strain Seligo" /NCGR_SAMPLE_ID=MMETSP0326_2 /ASSEMBLY_ACC=CAM_ASM_000348 /LENGTH=95 /DNA_ID=CAMNT_0040019423 /DNA_START=486 /DNA_END=773 /DNA_ORIENTATION=-